MIQKRWLTEHPEWHSYLCKYMHWVEAGVGACNQSRRMERRKAMAQWIRLEEGLIDLNPYTMYRARKTRWNLGVTPTPGEEWAIQGHTPDGDVVLVTYADSAEKAQKLLDAIYEALSTE